jgi:fatty-acyl-CoA synthase
VTEDLRWPPRADATCRDLLDALDEPAGVGSIAVTVDDGAKVATVELDHISSERIVAVIPGPYALAWKRGVLR